MLRGDLPPTALFQDATLKCAVVKCTEVTCRLLHLCRGRHCGHYGRTTDWLGVESFKLNKNKTKWHLSCALGCASHRINYERRKINNPNFKSISNAIWNPIHNPVNNAKTQELARVENEARIQKMPKNEDMLGPGEAIAEAIKIMTCVFYTLADANLEELLGIFPKELCDPRTALQVRYNHLPLGQVGARPGQGQEIRQVG